MKTAIPASPHRRLLLLLGISLLLHGLLLFHWSVSKPLLEFDYQLPNLALNMEPIEVVGQQQTHEKATTRPATHPGSKSQPRHHKTAVTTQTTSSEPGAREASNLDTLQTPAPATQTRTKPPAMNRALILNRIRHDLVQYFYYPPLARRQGIQGTVLLGFGISGQGAIHNIRVVKSSGYAILDLAAQDAMQRLKKLSWYATAMPGMDTDLELPIIFRLTEG